MQASLTRPLTRSVSACHRSSAPASLILERIAATARPCWRTALRHAGVSQSAVLHPSSPSPCRVSPLRQPDACMPNAALSGRELQPLELSLLRSGAGALRRGREPLRQPGGRVPDAPLHVAGGARAGAPAGAPQHRLPQPGLLALAVRVRGAARRRRQARPPCAPRVSCCHFVLPACPHSAGRDI